MLTYSQLVILQSKLWKLNSNKEKLLSELMTNTIPKVSWINTKNELEISKKWNYASPNDKTKSKNSVVASLNIDIFGNHD